MTPQRRRVLLAGAGRARAPCASPCPRRGRPKHGIGRPGQAGDGRTVSCCAAVWIDTYEVPTQRRSHPTWVHCSPSARAAASTMTTPPAPPPEAAPPAPEALPHNPSATIDNVDISTSRTEKSSPKRQPSSADEEQPRKHRRRQRSRAADWTTLHSADTKEEARTWMHKNTTTNMVWVYATGNHATVFKCAEHADCSFRCKVSKAQVRVPRVRCPVNSCYDTFCEPCGVLVCTCVQGYVQPGNVSSKFCCSVFG